MTMTPMLEALSLKKSYGTIKAVDDISIHAAKGETVAVKVTARPKTEGFAELPKVMPVGVDPAAITGSVNAVLKVASSIGITTFVGDMLALSSF